MICCSKHTIFHHETNENLPMGGTAKIEQGIKLGFLSPTCRMFPEHAVCIDRRVLRAGRLNLFITDLRTYDSLRVLLQRARVTLLPNMSRSGETACFKRAQCCCVDTECSLARAPQRSQQNSLQTLSASVRPPQAR